MINVVAAVVIHQGEILCVQKPKTKYTYTSFHWEFPGGKIEPGETPEQALHRELIEEMNYPVSIIAPLAQTVFHYPDFDIHLQCFLCQPKDKKHPREFVLKEHINAQWLKKNQLHNLNWCEADFDILPSIINYT